MEWSGDMAPYLLLNNRDPNNNKMNFAKPVVSKNCNLKSEFDLANLVG